MHLRNVDETGVLAKFGKKKKVFGPTNKHEGGYVSNYIGRAESPHVTSGITMLASDLKARNCIVEEKAVVR